MICLLSLLPLEKVSWILRGLLLLNILVLIYSLWALQGLPILARSPVDFLTSLPQIDPREGIGISLSTILLVAIDMKCQQYLVRACRTHLVTDFARIRIDYFCSDQLTIAIAGIGMAASGLLITEVAEKLLPISVMKKKLAANNLTNH